MILGVFLVITLNVHYQRGKAFVRSEVNNHYEISDAVRRFGRNRDKHSKVDNRFENKER